MCVLPRGATQSLGYALWDACSVLAARGLAVDGSKPELVARLQLSIFPPPTAAEANKSRNRPEVMWSRVFNALLADMRAKNQVWASKNLWRRRIEDNDHKNRSE